METTSNIIDKNWKALIKPSKLDILGVPSNTNRQQRDWLYLQTVK